jgi:hypothetical protein
MPIEGDFEMRAEGTIFDKHITQQGTAFAE